MRNFMQYSQYAWKVKVQTKLGIMIIKKQKKKQEKEKKSYYLHPLEPYFN